MLLPLMLPCFHWRKTGAKTGPSGGTDGKLIKLTISLVKALHFILFLFFLHFILYL